MAEPQYEGQWDEGQGQWEGDQWQQQQDAGGYGHLPDDPNLGDPMGGDVAMANGMGGSQPLCVSMDEMTSVGFDAGVFVAIVLSMLLPVPFCFRLLQVYAGTAGALFEILHIAFIVWPVLAYNCYALAQQGMEGDVRWQSEVFFPVVSYAVATAVLAGYHSFQNVEPSKTAKQAEAEKGGPLISEEQWEGLCHAGEFLETHNIFDPSVSVTQPDSEDIKLDLVVKIVVLSKVLALFHPTVLPLYYWQSATSNEWSPSTSFLCAVVASHFLVSQLLVTCMKGYLLFSYRRRTLERFTRLSTQSVAENPFQLQVPEGLQFWLDTRFIVLRHDMKRIRGFQVVMSCLGLVVVGTAVLLVLESLTSSGIVQAFEWIDSARVMFDLFLFGAVLLSVCSIGADINHQQEAHAAALSMKRYELSLMEQSGGDIGMNKTIVLINQVVDHMRAFDQPTSVLGFPVTPSFLHMLGMAIGLSVVLVATRMYVPTVVV